MEDTLYLRRGELAQSNADLVGRLANVARALERPIARPEEARAALQLGAAEAPAA
jgi:3-keto-5-aminohexanoate cleavage enzyme